MTSEPAALAEAYAHCDAQVRAADRGAWLAALFVPLEKRPAMHALDAFRIEIGSVRGKVREPLAGELRLQWWTDAIEGEARGDVHAHPVAAALLDTVQQHRLSRSTLTGLVDAKRDDLYDEPIATMAAFDAWADASEGRVFALRCSLLTSPDPVTDAAARHAGRAVAAVNALRLLGRGGTARPEMRLPLDLLAAHGLGRAEMLVGQPAPAVGAVRAAMMSRALEDLAALRRLRSNLAPGAGPAILTANFVEPQLKTLARASAPDGPQPSLPQWRQQWILWRASRRNGIV